MKGRDDTMASTNGMDDMEGKSIQNMYGDAARNVGTKEECSESNPTGSIQMKEESVQARLSKKRNTLLNKLTTIENQKFFARRSTMTPIQRSKTHWDYVLEEMQWMAIDFRQELRYKPPFLEAIAQACAEKKMHREFCKDLKPHANARDVAKLLSNEVQGLVSSLLSCPSRIGEEQRRDAMDVAEPSSEGIDFASVVEKVLSIATSLPPIPPPPPTVLPLSPTHAHSHAQRHASSHSHTHSGKYPSPALSPAILLPHQVPVTQHIERVGMGGLGALVFGKSFTGKTVSILHAAMGWIDKAAESVPTSPSPIPSTLLPTLLTQCRHVVVFCSLLSLPKWMGVVGEVFGGEWTVCIWGGDGEGGLREGKRLLMLVCLEMLQSYIEFLNSPHHAHKDTTTDVIPSASPKTMLCGFVLDVRATNTPTSFLDQPYSYSYTHPYTPQSHPSHPNSSHGHSHTQSAPPHPTHDKHRCKQHILTISHALSPLAIPRVMVSDPTLLIGLDRLAVLSVLVGGGVGGSGGGGLPYQQLKAYVKGRGGSLGNHHEVGGISPYPTLNQLLITLTHPVTLPPEHLTQANALVREEVVGGDLTPAQQLKYDEVCGGLVRGGGYDGGDVDGLSRVMVLIRMICMHEGLVSMKRGVMGVGLGVPWPGGTDKKTGGGGMEGIPLPYPPSPPSTPFWSYRPSPPSKADTKEKKGSGGSGASGTMGGVSFYPGRLLRLLSHPLTLRQPSEDLQVGSSKLEILKVLLLHRFAGLRVVVTCGGGVELGVIHHFLSALRIPHLTPNPPTSTPNPLGWMDEIEKIRQFNDPDTLSNILLIRSGIFQSPATPPWLADAVIVMGEGGGDGSGGSGGGVDYKAPFRLRLLRAGPSGDPVTVVRVVARRTIEEVMVRGGVGGVGGIGNRMHIHHMRGYRLSDLYFNVKDTPNEGGGGGSNGGAISLTNVFFLKRAPPRSGSGEEEAQGPAEAGEEGYAGAGDWVACYTRAYQHALLEFTQGVGVGVGGTWRGRLDFMLRGIKEVCGGRLASGGVLKVRDGRPSIRLRAHILGVGWEKLDVSPTPFSPLDRLRLKARGWGLGTGLLGGGEGKLARLLNFSQLCAEQGSEEEGREAAAAAAALALAGPVVGAEQQAVLAPSAPAGPPRHALFDRFRGCYEEYLRGGGGRIASLSPLLHLNPLQTACQGEAVLYPPLPTFADVGGEVVVRYMAKGGAGGVGKPPLKKKAAPKTDEGQGAVGAVGGQGGVDVTASNVRMEEDKGDSGGGAMSMAMGMPMSMPIGMTSGVGVEGMVNSGNTAMGGIMGNTEQRPVPPPLAMSLNNPPQSFSFPSYGVKGDAFPLPSSNSSGSIHSNNNNNAPSLFPPSFLPATTTLSSSESGGGSWASSPVAGAGIGVGGYMGGMWNQDPSYVHQPPHPQQLSQQLSHIQTSSTIPSTSVSPREGVMSKAFPVPNPVQLLGGGGGVHYDPTHSSGAHPNHMHPQTHPLSSVSAAPPGTSPRSTPSPLSWLPVEDDILICMQNAAKDPLFSHTLHWLNNAQGIRPSHAHNSLSGTGLSGDGSGVHSRSVQEVMERYAYLCAVGKVDERLRDPNVQRTIAKLKKTMKQTQRMGGGGGHAGSGQSGLGAGMNGNAGGVVGGGVGVGVGVGIGGGMTVHPQQHSGSYSSSSPLPSQPAPYQPATMATTPPSTSPAVAAPLPTSTRSTRGGGHY